MLEALIRGLRRIGADVDAVALADALWLARAMGDAGDATGTPDAADAPAGPAPATDPYDDGAGAEETPGPMDPYPFGAARPGTYDTPGGADGPGTLAAVTGRIRRGSALPDGPALSRALRPLGRRRPRGRESGLDVDATVELYARTGELTPVFAAQPERWFRLDLVVDVSPSMQVWREVADDLHTLLQRLGAFSTVRRWSLRPGPGAAPVLLGPGGGAAAPARLLDPQGRTLVLVLSDCVGDGWHAPGTWRMLRDWTRSTATVLLNPLPRTLWPYTGLDGPLVPLAARARGARSADLPAAVGDGLRHLLAAAYPEVTGPWLPCPVAEISAPAAGAWAGTLMATGEGVCEGVLIPPGGRPPDPEDEDPEDEDPYAYPYPYPYPLPPVAEPELLVDAFRRISSPQARRLAVLCSPQSELSLPVLRAVQAAMEPASGVTVLAELVVSDLFEHVPGTESGELRLRFRPGVREELRTSLSAEDAWQVYFALSRFVEAEAAQGTGHPVAFAAAQGPARIPDGLLPFAAASRAVLRLLGVEPAAVPVDTAMDRLVPRSGLRFGIDRSGAGRDSYTLEVRTLDGRGVIMSAERVEGLAALRDRVAQAMDRGWQEFLSEAHPHMIVVDVPRELLGLPLETWTDPEYAPPEEPYAVLHPVVFRCTPPADNQRARNARWNRLRNAGGRVAPSQVYWADAESPPSALLARLRADDRLLCLVLDGRPTARGLGAEQFRAAQAAGIPVVLWNREDGGAAGIRDQVEVLLAMGTSLPESLSVLHQMAWRETASLAHVSMVWNDPELEQPRTFTAPEPVPAARPPSRSRTYAVVIGVEAYTEPLGIDLDGPAHDVRGFTDWLLEQGVPPANITTLVSPVDANREVMEVAGLFVREATAENILAALLLETAVRVDADLLLVFWSGHGFTDGEDGSQYLLTADATGERVVSLTDLLSRFRSDAVRACDNQFWFIDACATPRDHVVEEALVTPPTPFGRTVAYRRQHVYMASGPENDAVLEPGRGGLFSLQLREALREAPPWDRDAEYALHGELLRRFAELRDAGRTDQEPRLLHFGEQGPAG